MNCQFSIETSSQFWHQKCSSFSDDCNFQPSIHPSPLPAPHNTLHLSPNYWSLKTNGDEDADLEGKDDDDEEDDDDDDDDGVEQLAKEAPVRHIDCKGICQGMWPQKEFL